MKAKKERTFPFALREKLQRKHHLGENNDGNHQRKHSVMVHRFNFLLLFSHKTVHDEWCAKKHRYHNKS